jgi:hypothetical protein
MTYTNFDIKVWVNQVQALCTKMYNYDPLLMINNEFH